MAGHGESDDEPLRELVTNYYGRMWTDQQMAVWMNAERLAEASARHRRPARHCRLPFAAHPSGNAAPAGAQSCALPSPDH